MNFFATLFGTWAALVFLTLTLYLGPDATPHDIGTPCRDHNGVRQFVQANVFGLGRIDGTKGWVVCRDGKVGTVE